MFFQNLSVYFLIIEQIFSHLIEGIFETDKVFFRKYFNAQKKFVKAIPFRYNLCFMKKDNE
jgi:hypothetical protein